MIKSFLRPVLTLQWKIFLSSQINFLIIQKKYSTEIEDGTHFTSYRSCWYDLYVNPGNLFNDMFPVGKVR